MPLHLYYDKNNIIGMVSKDKLITNRYKMVEADIVDSGDLIGKRIQFEGKQGIRLALICNWNDQCGISTYTQFLIKSLAPKLDGLKIFSEDRDNPACDSKLDVEYTWKRGQSMVDTVQKVLDWKPTIVMIQHEFGLFPKANYFLPMMEMLSVVPNVVTLHSVYEHKDKSVCTAAMKNVIVHSKTGQACLHDTLGHHNQKTWIIPHGCVDYGEVAPNWNFFGVPYPIIQFGFGFGYKGVDNALEAVASLKKRDKKFKDIFYCYMCSESNHAKNAHTAYYNTIRDKISELSLQDNATVQRGFFTDEELDQHLRTARLAIFPYVTDPENVVYGASGAIRIAMANGVPVIASASHMFDDMQDVLPRPLGSDELAEEIYKIFTDPKHKKELLTRQRDYIKNNTWEITAQRYHDVLKEIVDSYNKNVILL